MLKRIQALGRMKAGQMNKTEQLYRDRLELLKRSGEVIEYWFDHINLRLADKCFYKIDFFVLMSSGLLEVHEVKGKWEDDALVKIKVAANMYPFRFVAVQYVNKQWVIREF